jgi:predicted ArsR family transcriptional regulator
LLQTSFRRLSGRTGPGAGRPSKLYRRSALELDVSVPRAGISCSPSSLRPPSTRRRARTRAARSRGAARSFGRGLGAEARARAGGRAGGAALLRSAVAVLEEYGFAPAEGPRGSVRLRNCPFDALARRHQQLVCGSNLAFMEGVLAGLGATGLAARLDPQPGLCCVALSPAR